MSSKDLASGTEEADLADGAGSAGDVEVAVLQLQQALAPLEGDVGEDVGALACLAGVHDTQLDGDPAQHPILQATSP